MSLGTSAALSKPLCALSEPLFGVCAACSCTGGVFGAQAGAAGEGRKQRSAASCLCKGLVTACLTAAVPHQRENSFRWGKVLSQGVQELIAEKVLGICTVSLRQICLSQGWRSTCSRTGGPQAEPDPTGSAGAGQV